MKNPSCHRHFSLIWKYIKHHRQIIKVNKLDKEYSSYILAETYLFGVDDDNDKEI